MIGEKDMEELENPKRVEKIKIRTEMKKILMSLAIGLFALMPAKEIMAQDYSWGIGLRGAYYPAISVKHNLGQSNSIDLIASFRNGGVQATALYEWNTQVINQHFHLYYGVGGSLGFWNDKDGNDPAFRAGVDGILGLEFRIPNVPITLSIDYKPYVNFIGYGNDFANGALSIRYVF